MGDGTLGGGGGGGGYYIAAGNSNCVYQNLGLW